MHTSQQHAAALKLKRKQPEVCFAPRSLGLPLREEKERLLEPACPGWESRSIPAQSWVPSSAHLLHSFELGSSPLQNEKNNSLPPRLLGELNEIAYEKGFIPSEVQCKCCLFVANVDIPQLLALIMSTPPKEGERHLPRGRGQGHSRLSPPRPQVTRLACLYGALTACQALQDALSKQSPYAAPSAPFHRRVT